MLVVHLVLTNCVQAHDNCLEVLPHINLYLSTRQPRTIGSLVTPSLFEILYFQEFCLSRPRHFFQKSAKNHQKAGLRSALPPYGAALLTPTKAGAKYLVPVVLDNQNRALRLLSLVLFQIHNNCTCICLYGYLYAGITPVCSQILAMRNRWTTLQRL